MMIYLSTGTMYALGAILVAGTLGLLSFAIRAPHFR